LASLSLWLRPAFGTRSGHRAIITATSYGTNLGRSILSSNLLQ
jgi:hypothetical protein